MKAKFLRGFTVLAVGAMLLSACGSTCAHEYEDWEIENLPTENAEGLATRYCPLCEASEELVLPVLTDAAYKKGSTTADCENGGRQNFTFTTADGDEITFKAPVPALGHDYVAHAAVAPTKDTPIGMKAYYSCSRCEALFNDQKQKIDNLDGLKDYYYSMNETQHWHGNEAKANHTFGNWETVTASTYLAKGTEKRTCTTCGYVATREADLLDPGILNIDGAFFATNIAERNLTGANKLTDGLFIIGCEDGAIKIDSGGNIELGGKAQANGRVVLIKTAGNASVTIVAGRGTSGSSDILFGELDKTKLANNEVEFVGTPATSNSETTYPYTFDLVGAGLHLIGGSGNMKIKSITTEAHAIDRNTWQKDATGHWHGNASPDCTCRDDFAAHTFGNWAVVTSPTSTADGLEKRTCSVCGYEETRAIPAGTHHWSDTWSYNETQHWHACTDSGCNETKDVADHEFTRNGLTFTCACGYSYTMKSSLYTYNENETTYTLSQGNAYDVGGVTPVISIGGKTLPSAVDNEADPPEGPDNEFVMFSGEKKTLSAGLKTKAKCENSYFQVDLPGSAILVIYTRFITSTNFRIGSDKAFTNGTYSNLNGDTKPEAGTFVTFTRELAPGSHYFGVSAKDGRVAVYGFEIVYR